MVRNYGRPELANAGMWHLGARIAPRKYTYQRTLDDPGIARALVEDYVKRLRGAVNAWEHDGEPLTCTLLRFSALASGSMGGSSECAGF
jgi:hypothetical protein